MRNGIAICATAALLLASCASSKPDYQYVENQWADSIMRLGADLQPVYPPNEDIQIGDVYALEAGSAKVGTPLRTMKIGYVKDIIRVARDQYAQRLMLPASKFTSTGVIDRTKDQGGTTGSPFSGRFSNSIPSSAFPEYALAHGSMVDFSASLPGKLFGLLFGFGLAESTDLDVAVSDNSTIGIPAYDAQALLARFCGRSDRPCDQGRMRQAFRDTYGRWPTSLLYVRLVSRVHLTRTIKYTYVFRSAAAVRAAGARLDSMKVFAAKASSLVTPPAVPADNPATPTNESVNSARDVLLKQMLDSLQDDLAALSSNTGGAAFTFSGASYAGNSISLSQSFVRPLTFAYGGVWWSGATVAGQSLPDPTVVILKPASKPVNPPQSPPISSTNPVQITPSTPPTYPDKPGTITPQVVQPRIQAF